MTCSICLKGNLKLCKHKQFLCEFLPCSALINPGPVPEICHMQMNRFALSSLPSALLPGLVHKLCKPPPFPFELLFLNNQILSSF